MMDEIQEETNVEKVIWWFKKVKWYIHHYLVYWWYYKVVSLKRMWNHWKYPERYGKINITLVGNILNEGD